jgi:hypothetical protein
MRTYKTWEIIKMLSENPNLRFKAMPYSEAKTFFDEACLVNGVLCWGGNKAYPLQISIGKYDIDWKLIETPVTWHEALQAWAEGKTVICKLNDINEEYSEICFSNDYDTPLTRHQILYGQWFVVSEGVD